MVSDTQLGRHKSICETNKLFAVQHHLHLPSTLLRYLNVRRFKLSAIHLCQLTPIIVGLPRLNLACLHPMAILSVSYDTGCRTIPFVFRRHVFSYCHGNTTEPTSTGRHFTNDFPGVGVFVVCLNGVVVPEGEYIQLGLP